MTISLLKYFGRKLKYKNSVRREKSNYNKKLKKHAISDNE